MRPRDQPTVNLIAPEDSIDFNNVSFLLNMEKLTQYRERMLLYLEDIRVKLKKNPIRIFPQLNKPKLLSPEINTNFQENNRSFVRKEEIFKNQAPNTYSSKIKANLKENTIKNSIQKEEIKITDDSLSKEIDCLIFLMTPRLLMLSLKNKIFQPYLFQLSLIPQTNSPCLENYIFEWKDPFNFKTIGYINISWIKNIELVDNFSFKIKCYDYSNKDQENYKEALISVSDKKFKGNENKEILSSWYVEKLNFMTQKFKESAYIYYQHASLKIK